MATDERDRDGGRFSRWSPWKLKGERSAATANVEARLIKLAGSTLIQQASLRCARRDSRKVLKGKFGDLCRMALASLHWILVAG